MTEAVVRKPPDPPPPPRGSPAPAEIDSNAESRTNNAVLRSNQKTSAAAEVLRGFDIKEFDPWMVTDVQAALVPSLIFNDGDFTYQSTMDWYYSEDCDKALGPPGPQGPALQATGTP